MAFGFIAESIRAGQRDGSIRAGDENAISAIVLLSLQSLIFSAATTEALADPARRDAEAVQLFDRYLRPDGPA
jgi:hypothetical protein